MANNFKLGLNSPETDRLAERAERASERSTEGPTGRPSVSPSLVVFMEVTQNAQSVTLCSRNHKPEPVPSPIGNARPTPSDSAAARSLLPKARADELGLPTIVLASEQQVECPYLKSDTTIRSMQIGSWNSFPKTVPHSKTSLIVFDDAAPLAVF